ncbi:MAG: dCTP deaminase [Candidatus Peribacteraceae bacterium]|nr:dCTP deaminase [Candidatus Peribacteraceae bacterium]
MILSDHDIRDAIKSGRIKIDSPDEKYFDNIGPSSLDLRCGSHFKVYEHTKFSLLDPANPATFENCSRMLEVKDPSEPFIVQPNDFILGVTLEKITLPDDLVARVEGRSSLGRLGIIVHSTAGFVDPGFAGTITLEITNINKMPVALYPGMRVCQLAFETLTSPAEVDYSKKATQKYQNQVFPEESRICRDPEMIEIQKARK